MFLGVLWWDVREARQEVDAAEARGADAGIVANLRAALDQCERDGDVDSAQAIGSYAARLGQGGAYTVKTPTDVVVEESVDAARTVKAAAMGAELVAVAALAVLVVLAVRR